MSLVGEEYFIYSYSEWPGIRILIGVLNLCNTSFTLIYRNKCFNLKNNDMTAADN